MSESSTFTNIGLEESSLSLDWYFIRHATAPSSFAGFTTLSVMLQIFFSDSPMPYHSPFMFAMPMNWSSSIVSTPLSS